MMCYADDVQFFKPQAEELIIAENYQLWIKSYKSGDLKELNRF